MATNPITRAMLSTLSAEYKDYYNRGWKRSRTIFDIPDYVDSRYTHSQRNAWLDGYLDYACGRDKWCSTFHDVATCESH